MLGLHCCYQNQQLHCIINRGINFLKLYFVYIFTIVNYFIMEVSDPEGTAAPLINPFTIIGSPFGNKKAKKENLNAKIKDLKCSNKNSFITQEGQSELLTHRIVQVRLTKNK